MDERRSRPVSDETLDREVAAVLGVEPSPEFLARVRQRVATEPSPVAWPLQWMPVAAAAATIVVAVVVAISPQTDRVEPRERVLEHLSAPEKPAASLPSATIEAPSVPGAAPAPSPPASRAAAAANMGTERPAFPEVLISEEEVRAYRMFVAAVHERRMPPMPYVEAVSDADDSATLPDIDIAPLVIEPLPQIARLELGEGQ